MTTKLDRAFETARKLPAERQDELAEIIEAVAAPAHEYTKEQLAAVREGLADAEAGRFATDEEMEALFGRFRAV